MATATETLGFTESQDFKSEQRLAFFLPQLVDFSPDTFRREALAFAELIGPELNTELKTVYLAGLEEALYALGQTVGQNDRDIAFKVPTTLRKFSLTEPVVKDFGLGETEEGMDIVKIPATEITACKALPFPMYEDIYRPVLDVRIRTSADPSLRVYAGPGTIEERPSPGRWHRFPLHMIEVASIP